MSDQVAGAARPAEPPAGPVELPAGPAAGPVAGSPEPPAGLVAGSAERPAGLVTGSVELPAGLVAGPAELPAGSAEPPGEASGAAAGAASGGAVRSGRLDTVGRVLAGVVLAGFAVQAAVVECFLIPLHAGRWPVPVSVPAAMLGNVLLARAMPRLTGRRATALLPPVLWLLVVLGLAAPRPEGDLVVPGTLTGLAFLFLGATAGALGAASTIAPGRRWPRPDIGVPQRPRG